MLTCVVALVLLAHAPPATAQAIDRTTARDYFAEADAIAREGGVRLWGVELHGPLLFVDRGSREVVANMADPEGVLRPESGLYAGTWPASLAVYNGSVVFAGRTWTMLAWPLPAGRLQRRVLLAHEMFHRVQAERGWPAANPENPQLDSEAGRTWLRLEWRALQEALAHDGARRAAAIADALLFRHHRHRLFPEQSAAERALELNEGLAEYTGVATAIASDARPGWVVRHLDNYDATAARSSIVRNFAYASGPAYGVLLDAQSDAWRAAAFEGGDLGAQLAAAYAIAVPTTATEPAVRERAAHYGGPRLFAEEAARAAARRAEQARFRERFAEGRTLTLHATANLTYSFDPNAVVPFDDGGTIYLTSTVRDDWGTLTVNDGGVLIVSNEGESARVVVPAPADPAARPVRGPGWELELAEGWVLTVDSIGNASTQRTGDAPLTEREPPDTSAPPDASAPAASASPTVPAVGWKGNLHTHSLWSDGTDYPEMIVAWYREQGYDFLSLTEHDLLQGGERWVDVNAPDAGWPPRNESARKALPAYRARFGDWVDERSDGDRHLVRLRPLAEYRGMFERPDEFLLITGEEITDARGAHVNAFNLEAAIEPQGGATAAERIRNNLDAVERQRRALTRPLAAVVNHPNYSWAWTAEDIAGIPQARMFEVFNGHTMVNNAGDAQHASTERIWDVALTLRHASGDRPLLAVASDDAHDYGPAADTVSRPGRGWVMVRAPRLHADDIVRALDEGAFYASTGVAIRSEQCDGAPLRGQRCDGARIRIEIEAEPGVTYRTQFIGTRLGVPLEGTPVVDAAGDTLRTTRIYDQRVGAVLAEVEGTIAEYMFRGDERYVRAQVVSSRPHVDPTTGRPIGRQKAWLQPLFRMHAPGTAASTQATAASTQDTVAQALHRIFDESWAADLRANPLFASQVGVHDYDALLPDVTEAGRRQRLDQLWARLARLDSISYAPLPRAEQINFDIFRRLTEDDVRELEFRAYLMPFTTFVPFYSSLPEMAEWLPLGTAAGYEAYLARLRGLRAHMEAYVDLMRTGLRDGVTIPRVVLGGVVADLDAQLVDDPAQSRFYLPFTEMPSGIPASDQERLRQEGLDAIRTSVLPGYRAFRDFMATEYIPAARASIGASELPRGRAFYEHRVRMYTTLDVSPDEVHERGLAEVQRIRGEMMEVMAQAGFEGDFAAFLDFLRTDPRFYAASPEALLEKYALVLKRMDGQLPRLFRTLPRTPYGLRPIPDYMAPRMTTAYYRPPAGDGSTAGFYYVNTHDLTSRPLYEVEALSFHEAVPGHHLQNAIALELGEVPEFRRFAGFTAFGEGWALYAERLGLEVGFYADPYANFGRLSYEMWRALRLAVDTGIHWKGWSRQQAIDFMAENSALALHNISAEVDRYISWPGQALGYKMGELAIRDLRADAERRLGDRFDVRAFHEVILGSGEVPLDVLTDNVQTWVSGQGND